MEREKSYKVGHNYIDDIANSKEADEFVKWLPGMGNSKGIRPVRFKNIKTTLPAYIVLITRQISHKHHNPWDDIIDYVSGKIYYWGDAKYNKDKNYKEFDGNRLLLNVYENSLDENYSVIPPILHFSKTESGKVTFNGLCIINKLDFTWYEDNNKPIKNYRCELIILDEEIINVDWLSERVHCINLVDLNNSAPKTWVDYVKGRVRRIEVFKKDIRDTKFQLPEKNSLDAQILDSIINLTPTQFEYVLVELFRELPYVNHNITRTRSVKDGGFDFFGEFTLPYPIGYKIEFLGEAKRYSQSNGIGPELVSRLVARLGRGQYGIFVTTSFYTKQTQTEVLEDGYPVKLYSGIDLINFLKELRIIDNGVLNRNWLETILLKIV